MHCCKYCLNFSCQFVTFVLQKLTRQLSELKGEIVDLIRQKYVAFDSYVDNTQSLEQELRDVLKEHHRLSTRVQQDLRAKVANSVEQRPAIETKLKESKNRINLVQKLVVVYVGIENARKCLNGDQSVTCAEHIQDAANSLQGLADQNCDTKVYKTLKAELADVTSQLILMLREKWCTFVQWKPSTLSTLSTSAELSISPGPMLDDVVVAMKLLPTANVWQENIKRFAQKLFSMFVRPLIVSQDPLSVSLSTEGASKCLKIVLQSNTCSVDDLYTDLITVLVTAQEVLSISQDWMSGLGEVFCADMCQLVVAHRLSTAIPRDAVELANYDALSKQTQVFERRLVDLGLAKEEACQTLSQYAKQVNSHFAAQKSQDLLDKARRILMQPLHTTVTISEDTALKQLCPPKEGFECHLSSLSFGFPQCAVSKCVEECITLLYSTVKDCCSSSSALAAQLLSTCRDMVDLFCGVIASYHSQVIAELPSVAMIQHNNCVYVAHHLITLGHQFHSLLPEPLNANLATFVDLAPIVRKLGETVYKGEVKKQSETLLDILHSFGSLENVSESKQLQSVQRAMQQVISHISKVSRVYSEVLPQEISCCAIGALLNLVLCELVKAILSLEDIAVDDARELHAILTMFLERAPNALASDTQLVTEYCPDWDKLKQISVVLDASLHKIVELWGSNAGGVLALTFTPLQLRGLIKALFKNTERRAAAIAKITL